MLRSLSLRDFVIVETLDLDFQAGFTVLTGETGAGKSILLDALALALGERADASVVRENASRAEIAVEFGLSHDSGNPAREAVLAWLQEHDLDEGDEIIMLRRTVDSTGRSKAFINGRTATLTQMREVGDMLVDIHGQHAHQLLLKTGAQRQLLDNHAGLQTLAGQVAQSYRTWQNKLDFLRRAEQDQSSMEQERERLAWQVGELEKCAPQTDEWAQVQSEHTRLAHAATLLEGCELALAQLEGNDNGAQGALLSTLNQIIHNLQKLADLDPALRDTLDALEPAQVQLDEAAHALSRYTQKVELDPSRLAQVEERLQSLHSMARKYRVAPEELPNLWAERAAQLATLEQAQDMAALEAQAKEAEADYRKVATQLSAQRKKAATALSKAVTEAMQGLSMAGGRFEIALNPLDVGQAFGLEQVEFLVAAHTGVSPKPLAKVASGGELARISLAISVIASSASLTPTLVFDEVDSGIGGAVAEVVGQLLRKLGAGRQVLCVTHLPQVAAQGHQHLRVSKVQHAGVTRSQLEHLDTPQRVEEIARMLGGTEITATTRAHANEMLAKA